MARFSFLLNEKFIKVAEILKIHKDYNYKMGTDIYRYIFFEDNL